MILINPVNHSRMRHLNRGDLRYQFIKTGSMKVSVRLIISVHYTVIILRVTEAYPLISTVMFYADHILWIY